MEHTEIDLGDVDVTFGAVPKGKSAMAVMGRNGDTKLIWDPRNSDEVEAARRQFEFLTREKRFVAFKMNTAGERGELIREFDPAAERVVMVPQMQGG